MDFDRECMDGTRTIRRVAVVEAVADALNRLCTSLDAAGASCARRLHFVTLVQGERHDVCGGEGKWLISDRRFHVLVHVLHCEEEVEG